LLKRKEPNPPMKDAGAGGAAGGGGAVGGRGCGAVVAGDPAAGAGGILDA